MKKLFLFIITMCLFGATAFSQINNATLTGTVADATKAILPGVTITATNTATGVAISNVTNEAGAYTILSLLPGIAITITVVSLNVFGDGLRDALDPRAKVRIEH